MLTGLESPWHILILLLLLVIVFGPKRLPDMGRSLGSGLRGFKDSLSGVDQPEKPAPEPLARGGEPTERDTL